MKITQIDGLKPVSINRCIFIGPPGIGKTEQITRYAQAIAEQRKLKFIDLRSEKDIDDIEHSFYYLRIIAPHVFPEDVSIPRMTDKGIEFFTPHIIDVLTHPKSQGLVFIDELNNVQRSDQRVLFYSLIQEGEIGWGAKLNKDILIVSAGNPPEWSSDAVTLPNPLINRTVVMNIEPPSIDEWIDYMEKYHTDWDRRVAVFLKAFPQYFMKQPEEEDLKNYATPRSWTNLATRLYYQEDDDLIKDLAIGTIGPEIAGFFVQFLKTRTPKISEFVANPEIWKTLNVSQQMLLLYQISQNFKDFREMQGAMDILRGWQKTQRDDLILIIKLIPKAKRKQMLGMDFIKEFSAELVNYVD